MFEIEHEHRWAECIVSEGQIVAEIENLKTEFVQGIIDWHNQNIKDSIIEGINMYKEVVKELKSS